MSYDIEREMRLHLDGEFMEYDRETGRFYPMRVPHDFMPNMNTRCGELMQLAGARNGMAKPWSDGRDNQLIEWRAEGLTWKEIGRRMKRSDSFCRNRYLEVCKERGTDALVDVRRLKVAA